MTDILTVEEAAVLLRVSRSTIWRWCRDGTLSSAFKIGRNWRLHRSEVEVIIGKDVSQHREAGRVEQIAISNTEATSLGSPAKLRPGSDLSVNDLARHCQQETERYRAGEAYEEGYCLELFRQAIVNNNQPAWSAIYAQYQRLVTDWVWQHSRFQGDQDGAVVLANVTFERFWRSTSIQKEKIRFDSLAGLLRYLKSCVHTAVMDMYRQQQRQPHKTDRWDEVSVDGLDNVAAERAPTRVNDSSALEAHVLDRLVMEALTWAMWSRLRSDVELIVATFSWEYGLSPKEIQAHRPDLFANVQRVYRVKRTIVERLLNDSEIQNLRENIR